MCEYQRGVLGNEIQRDVAGMSVAEVLKFDGGDLRDIPAGLRALADGVERGEYGDAHNLVWLVDKGGGEMDVGMLGPAPEFGPTAYLLLGMAMQKIVRGCFK